MEAGAAMPGRRARAADRGLAFSAVHEQVKQDRGPNFLPHHAELARAIAGVTRGGCGTGRAVKSKEGMTIPAGMHGTTTKSVATCSGSSSPCSGTAASRCGDWTRWRGNGTWSCWRTTASACTSRNWSRRYRTERVTNQPGHARSNGSCSPDRSLRLQALRGRSSRNPTQSPQPADLGMAATR